MDIFLFSLFILVGAYAGRKELAPRWVIRNTGRGLTLSVYILLFVIGLEVGSYREILTRMGTLGLKAVALAAGGLLGSALFCGAAGRLFRVRH
jgi:uncharacterized membrane protein YbjE (DUF340 family)